MPSDTTFTGRINGLGGYSDEDNIRFARFINQNVGEVVELELEVAVIGPADLTSPATTCVSPTSTFNLGLSDPDARVVMDIEEVEALYSEPSLEGQLLGYQEHGHGGYSFILTYSVMPCLSMVVTAKEETIFFTSAHAHGVTAKLEGRFRVAIDYVAFDYRAEHVTLRPI